MAVIAQPKLLFVNKVNCFPKYCYSPVVYYRSLKLFKKLTWFRGGTVFREFIFIYLTKQ